MATKDQVYSQDGHGMKYPGEPDTVRPEWEDQRIRIEALRAAAALCGQLPVDEVLAAAEKMRKWVEIGER